ncbi:hypothetical protein [Lawsonibacter sp. JLR.KK007]|jgi:hypothetical protein|uniref:hypothetical protein n=1 Tax=Lawsonibacter sp. JLR.KK007 TaxID=3114293 RepID=UPI002FF3B804
MKHPKSLTREQYLKQFSRAVRWRLPPQESEDAIADYRELIFQEERDESKLVEELGEPVQAAHLLTDVTTYRRWLKVFAILAFGLFLLAKWAWTAHTRLYIHGIEAWWYPVWTMAVGLPLSLYWFRRHGQKSGLLPKKLIFALAVVLLLGIVTLVWTYYLFDPQVMAHLVETAAGNPTPWQIIVQRELLIEGGTACALLALAGLVLAKCYDRRWLALYILCVTAAAIFGFAEFHLTSMDVSARGVFELQGYLFARIIPIGAVGLIGTGVALC